MSTVQAEILDLLRELQAGGMAIILVTHDWGVLSDLCERGVVMYAGQVVEQAGVAEMVHAPRHPYTAGLLASNPVTPSVAGRAGDRGRGARAVRLAVRVPFPARCAYAQDDCGLRPVALVQPDGAGDRPDAVPALRPAAVRAGQRHRVGEPMTAPLLDVEDLTVR